MLYFLSLILLPSAGADLIFRNSGSWSPSGAVLVPGGPADQIYVGNCGPEGSMKADAVYMSPCPLAPQGPCAVNKGDTAKIYVNFTATEDLDAPYTYVYGRVGVWVPYSIGDYAKVCSHIGEGVTCPLKTGEKYQYYVEVPVLEEYPSLTLPVEFKMYKEEGSDDELMCFALALRIV